MTKKTQVIIIAFCAAVLFLCGTFILIHYNNTLSAPVDADTVESTEAEPLITFILPKGILLEDGGTELTVTVGARNTAVISVVFNGITTTLTALNTTYGDFSTYTASLTLPETQAERQNLGSMIFTARSDGFAVQTYTGAHVYIKAENDNGILPTDEPTTAEPTTAEPSSSAPATSESNASTTQIGNAPSTSVFTTALIGATTSGIYNKSESASPSTTSQPLDKTAISKICVVTSAYAETRPVTPLNNSYDPTYTPLAQGTMDTVVDVTEYDDGEDVIQYYVLASGRRITIDSASLLENCTLGGNSVAAVSSTCSSGNASINLSTVWRVPYAVSLDPQSYHSGYEGKKFNVSSFTANEISFTFFYTSSASGSFDVSGSDILSSATWSSNPSAGTSTLHLHFKNAGTFCGYSIGYNSDGTLNISITKKSAALAGSVIMIDAGHGGKDGGAPGYNRSVNESDVNLALAYALRDYLTSLGATVSMTRLDDTYISLEDRRARTEQIKPDVFISIHCNASTNSSKYGTSCFYHTSWSQPLAKSVNNSLATLFGTALYPEGSSDGGCCFYPFSVCRSTVCPSILVETAYISNSRDFEILLNADNRHSIVEAIGNGISDYLNAR